MALAAAFGDLGVVTYLCQEGADVNAVSRNGTGYTALTGAVAGSHASIVNWLAEYGADVNHRYAQGHSPLLEAAANGRLDIVKTPVCARRRGASAQRCRQERAQFCRRARAQGRGTVFAGTGIDLVGVQA